MGLNRILRMHEIRACLKADGNYLAERKGKDQEKGMSKFGPFKQVRDGI